MGFSWTCPRRFVRQPAPGGGGCRRIAYFAPSFDENTAALAHCYRAPRDAYRTAVRKAGLEEECILAETYDRAACRQTIVDYVRNRGCPDGVLCRNDEMALALYRAMCDLGIRVGRDVLVIGCDGIEDTQYLDCPLSTIALPVLQMCQLAWEFLANRMADPSLPRQHAVLEATLVLRESSRGTRG